MGMRRTLRFLTKRTYIWLILSGIVIYIVNVFTTEPHITTGGGNIGLLFLPVAIFFFLFLEKPMEGFTTTKVKAQYLAYN